MAGVGNPWERPEHAARFRDGAVPNNPSRPAQVDVVLALARAYAPRRVLDIGCGPGFLAERLLHELRDAHGTAFDPLPDDYDPAAFAAELEAQGDRLDPLRDRTDWMREAGFDPVEVFWRDGNRAVGGGLRPGSAA